MSKIRIVRSNGKWTVRASGAVIGETRNALEVFKDDNDPVIYFPRDDVAVAFLDESDLTRDDTSLGRARYYSIDAKNRTLSDAVWSFDTPSEGAEALAGHLAFQTGEYLQVERV